MDKSIDLAALCNLINEALDPGVFGSQPAPELNPWIENSGDGKILRDMCKVHGYGAVLHHVAALWRQWAIDHRLEGAERTIAASRDVRESWIRRANKALREVVDG